MTERLRGEEGEERGVGVQGQDTRVAVTKVLMIARTRNGGCCGK